MNPLDDPRLTAYALGELDEAERAEVEATLAASEDARRVVEETRAAAQALTRELAAAPAVLTAERKAAIDAALRGAAQGGTASAPLPIRIDRNRGIRRFMGITAAAAAIVLAVSFLWHDRMTAQNVRTLGGKSAEPSDSWRADADRSVRKSGVSPALKKGEGRLEDLSRGELAAAGEEQRAAQGRDKSELEAAPQSAAEVARDVERKPSGAAAPADAIEAVRRLQQQPAPHKESKDAGNVFRLAQDGEAQSPSRSELKPGYGRTVAPVEKSSEADANKKGAPTPVLVTNPPTGGGGGKSEGTKAKERGLLDGKAPAGAAPSTPGVPATGQSFEVARTGEGSGGQPRVEEQLDAVGYVDNFGTIRFESRKSDSTPEEMEMAKKLRALLDRASARDDLDEESRRILGTQQYRRFVDNPFCVVQRDPLSTFSIDVDTASYANIRRFLNEGSLPPRDAVRTEELVNYFPYDDPAPKGPVPFATRLEVAACPWNPRALLLRIGIKGREIAKEARKPSNFVFLVDVSGSMAPQDRLPLLKDAMRLLVKELTENDNVAIVTYAGESGVALPSTNAANKAPIVAAIEALQAGGSTNGASGIQLAYEQAGKHFLKGGVNRVILMTDGDFNVGIVEPRELERVIVEKAKSGVFLSVLGVGRDNLKDARMKMLSTKGNGNYAYVDSLKEARRVLVDQMNSTLVTIAKDVKIQVEFNPTEVEGYRLIGYENRVMPNQDFHDDRKDAGEVGAGHGVTALYEILPVGDAAFAMDNSLPPVPPLRYQSEPKAVFKSPVATPEGRRFTEAAKSGELLCVSIRYKEPEGSESKLLEVPLRRPEELAYSKASTDFKFSAAVAAFGMILRQSQHQGTATLDTVLELGEEAKGNDPMGYRREFLDLVMKAKTLAKR